MRLQFGSYLFDAATREMTREGQGVDLSPKAFDLLGALLQNRPRVLTKAELRDLLWPRTFVTETSLPRLVAEIRKQLGDRPGRPRFVRTAHRIGYAFCGEAKEVLSAGRAAPCWLLWRAREVGLVEGENLLGRGPGCLVRIPSSRVSRRHARILVTGGRATLEDLGSKNGTYHRGRRLDRPASLADGDEIGVGPELLLFCSTRMDSTKTEAE